MFLTVAVSESSFEQSVLCSSVHCIACFRNGILYHDGSFRPYVVFAFLMKLIEMFSNNFQKTNTKVITPTNHNRSKQHDEPIRIPSN